MLRLSYVVGQCFMASLVSYVCYISVRLLGRPVSFGPLWAGLIVMLGVINFFQPLFVKNQMGWVAEILKLVALIVAMIAIYSLDIAIAFSVAAIGYFILLAPTFITDATSLSWDAPTAAHTTVMSELKNLSETVDKLKNNMNDAPHLKAFLTKLTELAQQGDAKAEYNLGMMFEKNIALADIPPEKYTEQAFLWLTKAAVQGLPEAQIALGNLSLNGEGVPMDPGQAAAYFRQAEEKGNMDAEAMLGWLYAHGLGVDWDGTEAQRRYHKAIDGGSALGLWGLGDLYVTGNGVERNRDLGVSLFSQAADKKCIPAIARLALLRLAAMDRLSGSDPTLTLLHNASKEGDVYSQFLYIQIRAERIDGGLFPSTALWWGDRLKIAARADHSDAQWYWALVQENGWNGPANPTEAWSWLTRCAYKGYANGLETQADYLAYGLAGTRDLAKAVATYQTAARFSAKAAAKLVYRFLNGSGVARNKERSNYYLGQLRLWASHGNVDADYELGDIYRNGLVIPQNYAQAMLWYQKAADNGVGPAYYRLAEMSENGEGTPKDARNAYRYYRRAATLVYLPAFYKLAVMLQDGIGTPKDLRESREWFNRIERGAKRGNVAHLVSLAQCYEHGQFVARNDPKAAALYQEAAKRDDGIAEQALAKMLIDGRGVLKDSLAAYCWLDHAAQFGNGSAKHQRDALAKSWPSATRLRAQKQSSVFSPH